MLDCFPATCGLDSVDIDEDGGLTIYMAKWKSLGEGS